MTKCRKTVSHEFADCWYSDHKRHTSFDGLTLAISKGTSQFIQNRPGRQSTNLTAKHRSLRFLQSFGLRILTTIGTVDKHEYIAYLVKTVKLGRPAKYQRAKVKSEKAPETFSVGGAFLRRLRTAPLELRALTYGCRCWVVRGLSLPGLAPPAS
jgi:hypothetical protein